MATLSPGNTPSGIEMYNTLGVELTSLAAFKNSILQFQEITEPDIKKKAIIVLHRFLMNIAGNGANLSIERKAFFETNQFIETVEKEIINLVVIEAPDSLAEFKSGHGESFKSGISVFMDAVFHKEGGDSWRKNVFNGNLLGDGTLCKYVQPVGTANIDINIDYKNPANCLVDWQSYVNGLDTTKGPGARQNDPTGSQLFNYNFDPANRGFNIQGICYLCGTAIGQKAPGSFGVANCEHVMPILSALHASDFFFSKNEDIPRLAAIKAAIPLGGAGLTPADLAYIDKLLKISPEFAWSHMCCNMLKDNIEFIYLNNNGQYTPEYGNINKFLNYLFGDETTRLPRDSQGRYDCDIVFRDALAASGGDVSRAKVVAFDSLISRVIALCDKLNADNAAAAGPNDIKNDATMIKLYGMFLIFKNITLVTVKNIVTKSTVASNSRRGGGGSIITNTNHKHSKKNKKSKSLGIGRNIKMPMVGGNPLELYIKSLSMDENRKIFLYNYALKLDANSPVQVDIIKNILSSGITDLRQVSIVYNLALQLGANSPVQVDIIKNILSSGITDLRQVSIVYNLALQLGATQEATIQIIISCLPGGHAYEQVRPHYIQGFVQLILRDTQLPENITPEIIIQLVTNLNDQLIYDMRVSNAFHAIIYLLTRGVIGLDQVFDIDDTIGYLASRGLSPIDIGDAYTQLLRPLDIQNPNSAELVLTYYFKNGQQKDATIKFGENIIDDDIDDENVKNSTYKKIKLKDAELRQVIVGYLDTAVTEELIAKVEQDVVGSDIVTQLLNLLFEECRKYLSLPENNPNLFLRDILYDFISLYLKKKIVDHKISILNSTDETYQETFYRYTETSTTLGILLSSLLSVNKAIKVNNSEFTQILSGNCLQYNSEIFQKSSKDTTTREAVEINDGLFAIRRLKAKLDQRGIAVPVIFTHSYLQQPAQPQGQSYRDQFGPHGFEQVSVNPDVRQGDMGGGKLIRKRKTTRRNVVLIKRKKQNKSRKYKTRKHKTRRHKMRRHKRSS
jgi:hypothetical protein